MYTYTDKEQKTRRQLIELIIKSEAQYPSEIADLLIKDGWEKPLIKIGQTLYVYSKWYQRKEEVVVTKITIEDKNTTYEAAYISADRYGMKFDFKESDINKTVFLI